MKASDQGQTQSDGHFNRDCSDAAVLNSSIPAQLPTATTTATNTHTTLQHTPHSINTQHTHPTNTTSSSNLQTASSTISSRLQQAQSGPRSTVNIAPAINTLDLRAESGSSNLTSLRYHNINNKPKHNDHFDSNAAPNTSASTRIVLPSIQTRFSARNNGNFGVSSRIRGKSNSGSQQSTSALSNGENQSTVSTPFTTFDSQYDSPGILSAITTPSSGNHQQSTSALFSKTQKFETNAPGWQDKGNNVEGVIAPLASPLVVKAGQSKVTLIDAATLRNWFQMKHDKHPQLLRISNFKHEITSGRPTTLTTLIEKELKIGSEEKENLNLEQENQKLFKSNLDYDSSVPIPVPLLLSKSSRSSEESISGLGDGIGDKKDSDRTFASSSHSSSSSSSSVTPPVSRLPTSNDSDVQQPSQLRKVPLQKGSNSSQLNKGEFEGAHHLGNSSQSHLFSDNRAIGGIEQPLVLIISPERRNTIDLSAYPRELVVVSLELPSTLIDAYLKEQVEFLQFTSLTPFIVDEMSKRKFSAMITKDEYWRADIVIVDECAQVDAIEIASSETEDLMADQDDSDYTDATSLASSPLISDAATVLIDAIDNIRQMKKLHTSPLFLLKGGIASLHDAADGFVSTVEISRDSERRASVKMDQESKSKAEEDGSLVTPSEVMSPLFATHVSESPSHLDTIKRKHIAPSSLLHAITSHDSPSISLPYKSTNNKPIKPILARLKTSENVKRTEVDDLKSTKSAKLASDEIPRLSLSTSNHPRAAISRIKLNEQPLSVVHPHYEGRRETDPGLNQLATSLHTSSGNMKSLSLLTGKAATAFFEASEIIPGFLFLGPDITTTSELEYLKDTLGIKRILNAAIEIEEGGGKHLNLHQSSSSGVEMYKKLPLKDIVEGQEIQGVIDEACQYIDEAKNQSAPIYIHCKAGKSRSVMLVMAYLIYTNHWTLRESYAYVVERRREVSPNIGFVAELMAFEKRILKVSKSDAPDVR